MLLDWFVHAVVRARGMTSSRPRRIRLWLIGIVCYAAGVTSHIVLGTLPVNDSMQDAICCCFQFVWFVVGLFLIAVDLKTTFRDQNRVGWVFWAAGLLSAWIMVASAFPDK